ncbi:MAG: cyclic nucleotide-binding domain-containing protein [Pseudomonadota bacterium]|nr:cyclic nucleotide-binding domain-containing protein [Pseudomonadota bacterium]
MLSVELLGWAGSAATLAAYSMKTMLPLRIAAVLSSVFFISYYGIIGIWPSLALELVLLPFNLYRAWQILSLRRKVEAARTEQVDDFSVLKAYGKSRDLEAGMTIFRRGDAPDHLYLIEKGQVYLEEIDVTLGAGEIFGEIAFFSDAKERMATARCTEDTRIYMVDEKTFMQLNFQDPSFGIQVMRIITRRIVESVSHSPQLFQR